MAQEHRGLPTRLMLVAALLLIIGSVIISSLLVIRNRMQTQVQDDFSSDLTRSAELFRIFQAQRLAALERENALLADLPSLKALMTTSDERTIADAGVQFWQTSGNDLFALASRDGRIVAAYTRGLRDDARLRDDLEAVLSLAHGHFVLSGGHLFGYSVRPLYFGKESTGILLGYVISGFEVDREFLHEVNRISSSEIAFFSADRPLSSTLPPALLTDLQRDSIHASQRPDTYARVVLGGHRYLMASETMSAEASAPLRLVVLKSFDHPEQLQGVINRLLLLVGLCALLAGTALMLTISGLVTGPLEVLVSSVRVFGSGGRELPLPGRGPREVRELSVAFAAMRNQIREKSTALLEAERLATIGRMASSVSHDLRHYLAAVYANAEFLASSRHSEAERAELFAEIRVAVHGTTELIESLLIFSRTSIGALRQPESFGALLERSVTLVRAHPDAGGVHWTVLAGDPAASIAIVDAKQMERAIFNLLLNACQAARRSASTPRVGATLEISSELLVLRISDTGHGVPDSIRSSMFDPFVSAGKQNGTGLGLTLAAAVAREHAGTVTLVASRPGETIFALSIPRAASLQSSGENKKSAEISL